MWPSWARPGWARPRLVRPEGWSRPGWLGPADVEVDLPGVWLAVKALEVEAGR